MHCGHVDADYQEYVRHRGRMETEAEMTAYMVNRSRGMSRHVAEGVLPGLHRLLVTRQDRDHHHSHGPLHEGLQHDHEPGGGRLVLVTVHPERQAPMTRTTYVAEIQDPVNGEVTVLEAATPEELDALVEEVAADPTATT